MAFPTSSPLVAGQDSDIADLFFSSFDTYRCLLDIGSSPLPGKQLYGNSESIKSWLDTIDRANKSVFQLNHPNDANVFEFVTHPFRTYCPPSPSSDEPELESDISFPLGTSAWAPEVFTSSHYNDSDESRSESSLPHDVQYITIPVDSPWYRPPSPSPGPISAREFSTAAFAQSCSSDVRQAISQQELLLAVFHEELRRAVPHEGSAEYDSDWLENMDVDLVLAPLESYADLCWESAVHERCPGVSLRRPLPDVPTGFDEVHETY